MLPPWNELQSRLAIPTPAKNGALYGNTTRRNSFSLDLRESLRACRSEGQPSRARVAHRLTCDGRGYLHQFPGKRMVTESINKGEIIPSWNLVLDYGGRWRGCRTRPDSNSSRSYRVCFKARALVLLPRHRHRHTHMHAHNKEAWTVRWILVTKCLLFVGQQRFGTLSTCKEEFVPRMSSVCLSVSATPFVSLSAYLFTHFCR